MATQAAQVDAAPPAKKPSKKRLVIVATILLAMGSAGAWVYLKPHNAEAKPAKKTAEFLSLEPWFTVNLQDTDPEKYFQCGIVLEITEPKALDEVKKQMPVLRSNMLLLLSGKYSREIMSLEGKKKLVDELLATARDGLDLEQPNKGIDAVHFSIFVIQ